MTEQLQHALKELEEAGALMVPDTAEIEAAPAETHWSGDCEPAGSWELVKHREDSYTTHTNSEE